MQALMRALMRAAIAAAALAIGGDAGGIPARPAGTPADGFDHIGHQGSVVARAATPPPCSRCHRLAPGGRLAGAPGHAACFGDCHGPPPAAGARPDQAAIAVCRACHRPALLARLARGARGRIPAAFPPYDLDRDFALTISHAVHGRVERGCRACHAPPPEPGGAGQDAETARARARRTRAGAPHARCVTCHDRRPAPGGVGMDRCGACHTPGVGPARAPLRDPGAYPVRGHFSHRRHLARLGGAADPCRSCHAGAIAASGDRVPTPRKDQCRPCHDGKRAFSMTEPACHLCHGPPERERPAPALTRAAFSHRIHAAARPDLACTACHELDARGAAVTALRGHAPCSDGGCHDGDFASAAPRICGVCHVSGEPWRRLHADPVAVDATEFGADFSHRAHLAGPRPPLGRACARCHRPAAGGRFQLGPGHAACAGARCHGPGRGGAPPPLGRCDACHQLGLVAARERAEERRPWSVRARFTHEPHATEPSAPGRPVACQGCHAGALASEKLADMRPPTKKSCARCHDGRDAFKLTGHTCERCHGGAPAAAPITAPPTTAPPAPHATSPRKPQHATR